MRINHAADLVFTPFCNLTKSVNPLGILPIGNVLTILLLQPLTYSEFHVETAPRCVNLPSPIVKRAFKTPK